MTDLLLTVTGTFRLMEPKKAEQLAKELNEDDPEWLYVAVHDPKGTGQSYIDVFDEDGILLGAL